MARVSLETLFSRRGIWRNDELVSEGVQFRDLAEALKAGTVVRPVFVRRNGPVHGIFVTPELNMDPERAFIVGTVLTGGVVGRHSAGFRHELTTDLPNAIELHVRETFSRAPKQIPMTIMRSRNEGMRTVGIDYVDTEFGVQIPMTSRARTVVDIFHSGRRIERDREHAMDALEHFFQSGGEPGEITRIASDLGLDKDDKLQGAIDAVFHGLRGRRM